MAGENVKFGIPALNKKYDILTEHDHDIKTPPCTLKDGTTKVLGYDGKISGVKDALVLDAMIERGSNLVAVKAKPEPDGPDGEKKK